MSLHYSWLEVERKYCFMFLILSAKGCSIWYLHSQSVINIGHIVQIIKSYLWFHHYLFCLMTILSLEILKTSVLIVVAISLVSFMCFVYYSQKTSCWIQCLIGLAKFSFLSMFMVHIFWSSLLLINMHFEFSGTFASEDFILSK